MEVGGSGWKWVKWKLVVVGSTWQWEKTIYFTGKISPGVSHIFVFEIMSKKSEEFPPKI